MLYITRACDEGHTKYESGNYKTIKVQTYGVVNLNDEPLNYYNNVGQLDSERFIVVSMKTTKKRVIPAKIVNFNDDDQNYLDENPGLELSKGIKSNKIFKFKADNTPCTLTCENGVFYAYGNYELLIYNI